MTVLPTALVRTTTMSASTIRTPDSPDLAALCQALAAMSPELDRTGQWPARQLALCGEYGVFEWFIESEWGGQGWDDEAIVRGYLALSSACLTTTFIITQRSGACRRIAMSESDALKSELLPVLARGESFATIGISHLTTSRRHLAEPALRAERIEGGFILNGYTPWVTGAAHAEHVVLGATLMKDGKPTGEQLLITVPTELSGVSVPAPAELVGVSASHTGEVQLKDVQIEARWVLAGPVENVMAGGGGAGTGGHQTSTLALGLSRAAVDYIESEAVRRGDLQVPLEALRRECEELTHELLALVRGESACTTEQLRQRANSLVLRSTQSALAAAKGAGFVIGHPAGRWCREALFFLVWSCPQPVVSANLCELAGLAD